MEKGSKHTEETKSKISLALRGNANAMKHGERSDLQHLHIQCNDCPAQATCKGFEYNCACQFQEEFRVLAERLGTRNMYALVDFCFLKLELESVDYLLARHVDRSEGMTDPATLRRSANLDNTVKLLYKLLGGDRGKQVYVDNRRINLAVAREQVDLLSEEDFTRALRATRVLADLGLPVLPESVDTESDG